MQSAEASAFYNTIGSHRKGERARDSQRTRKWSYSYWRNQGGEQGRNRRKYNYSGQRWQNYLGRNWRQDCVTRNWRADWFARYWRSNWFTRNWKSDGNSENSTRV